MNGAGNRNYDDIINTQWPPADEKAGKIQFDGAVMDQIYWD